MAMRFQISKFAAANWVYRIKESGNLQEIFSLYRQMKEARIGFTDPTILFPPILKACGMLSFRHGKAVHSTLIKEGLDSFTSIGNSVLDFYAKSGNLIWAIEAFDQMRNRDSVSWNIIIHGHLQQGVYDSERGLSLFFQAKGYGFTPNISTLVLVIQACRESRFFDDGVGMIHGYLVRSGFWIVSSVQNSLLCVYADMEMESAHKLFDEMLDRDVIAWSVMIGSYVQDNQARVALQLFRQMLSEFGIQVDGQIMVNVLRACTDLRDIRMAKMIHSFVIPRGLDNDLYLGNSLVDLYSKCQDSESASRVFNEMPEKNIVSWNSMFSGLVQNEKHSEALLLFESMAENGIEVDEITLVSLLQLCKYYMNLHQCKLIHSKVIRQGYESNEMVMNSLIDSYAKCNDIKLAWKQFKMTNQRDAITWTAMIAGFAHCGMPEEAIAVFQDMNRVKKEKPNSITMLNLVEACSLLCAEMKILKSVHGIAIRHGSAFEVEVGTAILDMYSKSGAIHDSRKSFEQISDKNIVSWGALISAYGMNGFPHEALSLHAKLNSRGLKPNLVTTLSVLSACSHGGLVEEGLILFENLVQEHGPQLGLKHYSCLVDLLARAGMLDTALDLLRELTNIESNLSPGASAWGAIFASKNYRNTDIGTDAVTQVIEFEPWSSSGYMMAYNMYAGSGLWSDAARMRLLIKERGVKVIPGSSVVYVNSKACKFVAGDKHKHHQLCSYDDDDLWSFVKQMHLIMRTPYMHSHDEIFE